MTVVSREANGSGHGEERKVGLLLDQNASVHGLQGWRSALGLAIGRYVEAAGIRNRTHLVGGIVKNGNPDGREAEEANRPLVGRAVPVSVVRILGIARSREPPLVAQLAPQHLCQNGQGHALIGQEKNRSSWPDTSVVLYLVFFSQSGVGGGISAK